MAREHFRALARQEVTLAGRLASADGAPERPVRVINLGLGGACVGSAEALPVGASVRLSIVAPHLWDPLVLDAQVAWVQSSAQGAEAEIGLRFTDPAGSTLRLLTELLETHRY